MCLEDRKCLACETGTYVHKEWKEESRYLGEVNVVSEICDTCGHDYYKDLAKKIQEQWLAGYGE